ncbi:Glu-tRNA(Gln) amidotransferase subunit GatD [Candidatus Pyrohabitans sp.]
MYRGEAAKVLHGAKVGERVRIIKGERTYEGVLMPRSELGDARHVVIKLDSGYNIGVEISGARVERLGSARRAKAAFSEPEFSPEKPEVVILGTGGTIASKIDYATGAVHPSFSTAEIVNAVPELADIARLRARVLFNILSENMTPKHWRKIAEEVAKELNGSAQGVVVAHGTDTMSYTGAALAFMLKNLTKPVVLVGSQRSSDRPSSDAALNLIAAAKVATSDLAEVVVVMHASTSDDACAVHRATKVRKMHSSRRDAFKSINALPLGEVRDQVRLSGSYRRRCEGEVYADTRLEERVALFKAYPGVDPELLERCVDRCRGIVLEGTGLGHVPEQLFPAIQRAREEGKAVVMTTSTLYGRVDMKVYSTGRRLLNLGVIPGEDMLPEVAYVKLMHVLAIARSEEEVRSLMLRNFAGEITERTLPRAFY